jgi:peptide/nickel transport system ATP-binding protein
MGGFIVGLDDLRIEVKRTGVSLVGPLQTVVQCDNILFIIGQSGSGKTLLARAIAGVLPTLLKMSGNVILSGPPDGGGTHHANAVYVPQFAAAALPALVSPKWLVEAVVRKDADNAADASAKAVEYLERLDFSSSLRAAYEPSYRLSGGMARRVVLAAALATRRRVIILDEPTIGLDPMQRLEFRKILTQLIEYGRNLIVITHDLPLVRYFEGSVMILERGTIRASGAFSAAQRSRDRLVRQLLGTTNLPPKTGTARKARNGRGFQRGSPGVT